MKNQEEISFKQKIKYRFDNLMSAGPIALIGTLALLSIALVIIAGIILVVAQFSQEGAEPLAFIEASWESLMRTLDPGTMGQDTGWGYRVVMLFVTIGGIFIVSTLIGVLSNGISNKLDELRKGHSSVLEKNHTLILGWSEKIFPIISELIVANTNQKKPRIVILSSQEKIYMEDDIRLNIPDMKNTKIICRNGNPIDIKDLEIVNPHSAKSIIILEEAVDEPDIHVIKSILAITNNPHRKTGKYHIVAEINDVKKKEVAETVGKDELTLVQSDELISRVIAQTCRQSGLSIVYTELLDFEGAEIYFHHEPKLQGMTYKDAIFSFKDSSVIGLRFGDGRIKINPPMNTILNNNDSVIAISEDDDTVIMTEKTDYKINKNAIIANGQSVNSKENTLILGWNSKGLSIIRELDSYLTKGSTVTIVADLDEPDIITENLKSQIKNQEVIFISGHTTDRKILENLELNKFDHIILLCYSDKLDVQKADSITLITLLQLRNISEKLGKNFSVVSEMLDMNNKQLAEVTKADDFIVSNKIISLMLTQLSENKELKGVFDDLFNAEGSEIYLKPAKNYINTGEEVNFYTILESAALKNETAIGFRKGENAFNPEKQYGVVVNPNKPEMIILNDNDKIIVLAED
jgi:ion channel POLLUX/CASTOR